MIETWLWIQGAYTLVTERDKQPGNTVQTGGEYFDEGIARCPGRTEEVGVITQPRLGGRGAVVGSGQRRVGREEVCR